MLKQFNSKSKLLSHNDWLDAYCRGEQVIPICIEMDLTNRCDYKCPSCVWRTKIGNKGTYVPEKYIIKQIKDCSDVGIKSIIFTGGGEPLLHPGACKAIELARSLCLDVGLYTNGLHIDSKISKVLVECCSWVQIHLDSIRKTTYERVHGSPASNLSIVMQNLRDLNILVEDSDSKINISIGSVINYDNFDELENLADFALEVGCHFFQAKHDINYLPDKNYMTWWTTNVVPLLQNLEKKCTGKSFGIQYSTTQYHLMLPKAKKCHIHNLVTAVNASGNLVYCKRARYKDDWSAGNIRSKTMKDVLYSDRNRQLNHKITPQNCGIICPYIELNDFIEDLINSEEILSQTERRIGKHRNFF